jgi:hypothetical protein
MVRPKVEPELKKVHPQAAGIDIGASEHWVSIPSELDPRAKRSNEEIAAALESNELNRWVSI